MFVALCLLSPCLVLGFVVLGNKYRKSMNGKRLEERDLGTAYMLCYAMLHGRCCFWSTETAMGMCLLHIGMFVFICMGFDLLSTA